MLANRLVARPASIPQCYFRDCAGPIADVDKAPKVPIIAKSELNPYDLALRYILTTIPS